VGDYGAQSTRKHYFKTMVSPNKLLPYSKNGLQALSEHWDDYSPKSLSEVVDQEDLVSYLSRRKHYTHTFHAPTDPNLQQETTLEDLVQPIGYS